MKASAQSRAVVPLGLAQTLAWASSYYLPAMLAAPMARDLGIATPTVFAAFSVALVVGGSIVIPHLRRAVDFLDRLEQGDAAPPEAHDHAAAPSATP